MSTDPRFDKRDNKKNCGYCKKIEPGKGSLDQRQKKVRARYTASNTNGSICLKENGKRCDLGRSTT